MTRYTLSSWKPHARENIAIDTSSDVSSDEEEADQFYFIRLVSGNWKEEIIIAGRLVWNSWEKLLNRRPDLGQLTALPDATWYQDARATLGNDFKENWTKLRKKS